MNKTITSDLSPLHNKINEIAFCIYFERMFDLELLDIAKIQEAYKAKGFGRAVEKFIPQPGEMDQGRFLNLFPTFFFTNTDDTYNEIVQIRNTYFGYNILKSEEKDITLLPFDFIFDRLIKNYELFLKNLKSLDKREPQITEHQIMLVTVLKKDKDWTTFEEAGATNNLLTITNILEKEPTIYDPSDRTIFEINLEQISRTKNDVTRQLEIKTGLTDQNSVNPNSFITNLSLRGEPTEKPATIKNSRDWYTDSFLDLISHHTSIFNE